MLSKVLFAALLCTTANAFGAALNSLGQHYNAILFGNLNASGGDTEGRLLVGGNATYTVSYGVGSAVIGLTLPPSSTRDDLVVLGNLSTITNWGVNANAVYGGTLSGPGVSNLSPGATQRQQASITLDLLTGNALSNGLGITMAQLLAESQANSSAWGSLADRGVVTKSAQFTTLTLEGNDAVLNVFNITAADWTNSTIDITAPAGSTVLINVGGTTVTASGGAVVLHGVTRENVLYNLPKATVLSLASRGLEGSLLAPFLTSGTFDGGNVNGQSVLSGTITQQNGFEFHNFPFNGIPGADTPEPATAALAVVGLVVFWMKRRR